MRTTAFLIELLSRYVGASLVDRRFRDRRRDAAPPGGAEQRLRSRGFDVSVPLKPERYIPLDAAATLARFMRGAGSRIRRCSTQIAWPAIEDARAAASAGRGRVVAFGEMVALLWAEGRIDAALQLEEMWNRAGRDLFVLAVLRVPDERLSREPARGAVPEDLRAAHARLSRRAAPLFRISLTCTVGIRTSRQLRNSGTQEPTS